ncbi:MAG: SP_1767 family glycosyltransferase [Ruminococcus sp.]|nr:SP_1767 family glycosyltransferase [Ruminococcus sp.]
MKDSSLKRLLVKWYEFFDEKIKYINIVANYRLNIWNSKKTINYIIKNNCSISRYGDGEINTILGESYMSFQKQSDLLAEKLTRIVENGSNDKLLVCMPRYFNNTSGCNKRAKNYWKRWRFDSQEKIYNYITSIAPKNAYYGDSEITRPYMDYKNDRNAKVIFPLLKKLWDNRDIIILEGTQSRLGVGNDLFDNAKSIKRILAPAKNASEKYDEIFDTTLKLWNGELLLIALGPTATALAADFSEKNIQALDIGHIDIEYEWFLSGAKTKVAVPGKYTNEAVDGRSVGACEDKEYLAQIIGVIDNS